MGSRRQEGKPLEGLKKKKMPILSNSAQSHTESQCSKARKKIEGMSIETELKYVTIYKDTSVYSQTLRAFIQRSS